MIRRTISAACLLAFVVTLSATAQDEKPTTKKDEKKKEAAAVSKASGYFQPIGAHEIKANTEKLTAFKIQSIAPHGAKVKKGQVVVTFQSKEIDKKIEDAEAALRLAELDHADAEFDFKQFQETQKLDRAAAARTRQQAQQAYDNYVKVDRDARVESTEFNLRSYHNSLENAMEELEQLEKMYKEDELTEESEEIVLKRAKRSVESAQYRLKTAEVSAARTLKQAIPREAASQEDALARAIMAFDKATRSFDTASKKRTIEFEKTSKALAKQRKDLAQMREERKRLALRSPAAGIAYHGTLTRGRMGDKPSTLKKDSAVTAKQTIVTIVDPTRLQIRVDLPESLLGKVKVGGKGTANAKAYKDRKLPITVKSLSYTPMSNGKHDCVLSVKLDGKDPAIMPAMSCEITFE